MGRAFGASHPEPRRLVLSVRRIADHHRLGRSILPSVWFHAHPRFERPDTQNRAHGSRTRRSSEREPADSLRDKSNAIGGWLPSLTFLVSRLHAHEEKDRHPSFCSSFSSRSRE